MTSETILRAIRNQTFEPFDIFLADGRTIHVGHPEHIAYREGSRTAMVLDGDSFEYIDLRLATGLRLRNIPEVRAAGGRGGSA